jgi:hypothetical protein
VPDNLASQRVLEKAGFQREGHLRSYLVFERQRADALIYSLLPSDLVLSRTPARPWQLHRGLRQCAAVSSGAVVTARLSAYRRATKMYSRLSSSSGSPANPP